MVTPKTVTDFAHKCLKMQLLKVWSSWSQQTLQQSRFQGVSAFVRAFPEPRINVALGKGGQSLNKSRSRLEKEWAEHHSREQREMEISTDRIYTRSGV